MTSLVDFDRALWGDAEIEFALLDYCSISEPPFWEGYGSPLDESPAAMVRGQESVIREQEGGKGKQEAGGRKQEAGRA